MQNLNQNIIIHTHTGLNTHPYVVPLIQSRLIQLLIDILLHMTQFFILTLTHINHTRLTWVDSLAQKLKESQGLELMAEPKCQV